MLQSVSSHVKNTTIYYIVQNKYVMYVFMLYISYNIYTNTI